MKINFKRFHKYFLDEHIIPKILILLILLSNTTSIASHRVAPSFSLTHIQTTEGDHYNFYSPTINYTADFKIWNFRLYLSLSILFPMWANQNGKKCDLSEFYTSCMGTDIFIGISKDYPIADRLLFVPAVGYHLNGIRLRGKPEYMDFYSLTSGLGINVMTRYRGKHNPLNIAFISFGIDFSDMLYTENKLKTGYTIIIGVGHAF